MAKVKKVKEKKKRVLYKGVFTLSHEMIIKYLCAFTPAQAKVFMMRRIAKEQGVPYGYVFNLFDGSKKNYRIEEQVK